MQCAKFEQRLQQLLDDRSEVEQDKVLREHADACDECHEMLKAQQALFTGLGVLPESARSKDMGHRVLDSLLVERRYRSKRRLTMIVLAVTAVLLIALIPLTGSRGPWWNKQPVGGGQLAMAYSTTSEPGQRKLSKAEAEELRLLMRDLVMRLSDPRFEMFESVDQLTSGIRPLAVTFNYAIDTLRRSLPGYSEHETIEPQALFRKTRATIG